MTKIFDLFVIGAGSGGVRASRYASSLGLKTGLAEGWSLGGTCVNRGCVPKKLYSYASHFSGESELMKSYGWNVKKKFSWKKLVSNKKKEIRRLNDIYLNLLKSSKVQIFDGYAEFINEKTIKVKDEYITAKKILICVGSKPRNLKLCDEKSLTTSDEAFDLKKLPKNILILGGGYIAVEFASIFNDLGINTTICIRGKRILKDFDIEISDFLMEQMNDKGVNIIKEDFPNKIKFKSKNFHVFFKNEVVKYEKVMEATGRVPNLEKLKIEKIGIKLDRNKAIIVDEYFRTSCKNIYAIGDIINKVQLTPVAIAEAMTFVKNLTSNKKEKFNYSNIPSAVFSNPNYAFVGYTELQARKKYKKIQIYREKFRSLKVSLSSSNEKVFIKLITNKLNDKILGLHYVGENAAEIIQGFSVAIVNGLTKKQFDKTIGIHPTSAEEIVTLKNKEY